MQLLDADAVRAALPMGDAVEAARATFAALAAGLVTAPPRSFTAVDALGEGGFLASMPVHVGGDVDAMAVKVLGIVPANADRGLATINGLVVVLDGTTGLPLGAVDGTALTAIRTAAVSGLAVDLLAGDGPVRLGVLGAGVQGREHVDAVAAVRELAQVSVWNRSAPRAEGQVASLRDRGVDAVVARSPGEAVAGADVVCACTASDEALVAAADLANDVVVTAVGAFTPTMRELAADVLGGAFVVADTHAGVDQEKGDLLLARDERDDVEVACELADLVVGDVTPPTTGRRVFLSVGHAAEDAVTAARLLRG